MIALHMRHLWANSRFEAACRKNTGFSQEMAHMRRDRVLWHIGLKLCDANLLHQLSFISVPHVTFARE